MAFFKSFVFIIVFLPTLSLSKTVEIVVNAPFTTPQNAQIYLTGNIRELCSWRTDCLKLKAVKEGSYLFKLDLPANIKDFRFKITRGSWENEASDSYSHPYQDYEVTLSDIKKPLILNIAHWKDLPPLTKSQNVLDSFWLYSTELGLYKEISVYLPANYKKSSKFYPVIYMHDGQNVFDPTISSYGNEWSIDETMDKLTSTRQINEAIIVAIHTTNTDRETEYDYHLKGKQYSDFVVNGVIPFVERNFRIIKNKNARFLMGSSLGALISLMMVVDRQDIFNKAAALSLPARINNRSLFKFLATYSLLPQFDFYMDHGDWGIDSRYEAGAKELYSELISRGMSPKQLEYRVFPFSDHNEIDWARRSHIPLKFLLNSFAK